MAWSNIRQFSRFLPCEKESKSSWIWGVDMMETFIQIMTHNSNLPPSSVVAMFPCQSVFRWLIIACMDTCESKDFLKILVGLVVPHTMKTWLYWPLDVTTMQALIYLCTNRHLQKQLQPFVPKVLTRSLLIYIGFLYLVVRMSAPWRQGELESQWFKLEKY